MQNTPDKPPADSGRPTPAAGRGTDQVASGSESGDRAGADVPAVERRAGALTDSGHHRAARNVLASLLAGLDPITAPADPQLVDLVQTYLVLHDYVTYFDRVPRSAADDDFGLSWSLYALRKTEDLFGTRDPKWSQVAARHARVLAGQGLTGDAVTVHRRRLEMAVGGRHPESIAETWRAVAYALHADGQCGEAHDEIAAALRCWHITPDPACRYGTYLLRAALLMLAGCGDADRAIATIEQFGHLLGAPGSGLRADNIHAALVELRSPDQRHHPLVCQLHPDPRCTHSREIPAARIDRWAGLLTGGPGPYAAPGGGR